MRAIAVAKADLLSLPPCAAKGYRKHRNDTVLLLDAGRCGIETLSYEAGVVERGRATAQEAEPQLLEVKGALLITSKEEAIQGRLRPSTLQGSRAVPKVTLSISASERETRR